MELIRSIERNELLASNWGIYRLSEEQENKFGGKFALSQGIISDYALEKIEEDELLSALSSVKYEGFFKRN